MEKEKVELTSQSRIMIIDTETTNSLDDPVVYDVGFEVFDLEGNTYESCSMINTEVFNDPALMSTAYYADKIPQYLDRVLTGQSVMIPWKSIKTTIKNSIIRNNCEVVCAHNARFDSHALNLTQRYITTSKWRYFLPYGTSQWWDTLRMAREILKNNADYRQFCLDNGYVTSRNVNRYTAEVIYRFLTGENDFNEAHMGLDDVRIEKEIFLYCIRQNPDIDGRLWKPKDSIA